ncbi:MAG: hypothetical protein IKH42_03865, partial [Lachnospiraceae bacterium]|nr:hypothetical protein [Lachnospiraceae bacterium]
MAPKYDGSEIVVLKGLEAVRKRPGMYIGSVGSRGLHHLIWEILDNGIDEHLAGFCDAIEITMQKDGGIAITDHGRGVPVDMHPTEHMPTARVVYTVLHAGGKFGNNVYKVSGGLHGVGASVKIVSDSDGLCHLAKAFLTLVVKLDRCSRVRFGKVD